MTPKIFPHEKRQGSCISQSDFQKTSDFSGHFTDVFTKMTIASSNIMAHLDSHRRLSDKGVHSGNGIVVRLS